MYNLTVIIAAILGLVSRKAVRYLLLYYNDPINLQLYNTLIVARGLAS